jgi:DnaJ-class molecular chaperone
MYGRIHDCEKEGCDNPCEPCRSCGGDGGYDASTDCETYDDWQECPDCEGTGKDQGDIFIPERDAFRVQD